MSFARRVLPALAALAAAGAGPAAAAAAPPANDNRANAEPITLPASVTGTTVDATLENVPSQGVFEPQPSCGSVSGSVWYAFTAPRDGTLVVRLNLDGDQDATLDVIRRVRSQLTPQGCERTSEAGNAAFDTRVTRGGTYLIRVGRRVGSDAGGFRLTARLADPPPSFPGRALPRAGARGTLDRLADPADAFTVRLREGVSYLVTSGVSTGSCALVRLFSPSATSFAGSVASGCNWVFFTPEQSGRFSILLEADRAGSDVQAYRLRARAVRPDETAPGVPLPNLVTVRGSVSAPGGDPFDLFRFDVARRSQLDISLGAGADQEVRAQVVTPSGRPVTTFTTAEAEPVVVPRGRYYVLVVSDGRAGYRLRRSVRTITSARVSMPRRVRLGARVSIGVRVAPRVRGPVTVVVDRFEPAFGWQFDRRVRVQVANGRAVLRFRPGRSGLWRASAEFLGTRIAAPSSASVREFVVTEPLAP